MIKLHLKDSLKTDADSCHGGWGWDRYILESHNPFNIREINLW